MKIKIVILSSLFSLGVMSATQKNIYCSAQLLSSGCGSGEEYILLRGDGTFYHYHGDVACWGTPEEYRGSFTESATNGSYPYFKPEFQLLSDRPLGGVQYAKVIVDDKRQVGEIIFEVKSDLVNKLHTSIPLICRTQGY